MVCFKLEGPAGNSEDWDHKNRYVDPKKANF